VMTADDARTAPGSDEPDGPGDELRAVPFDVSAPAVARAVVEDGLRRRGCEPSQRQVVLTVVTELVMNALLHGAAGDQDDLPVARTDDQRTAGRDGDVEGHGFLRLAWAVDGDRAVTVSVTDFGSHDVPHLESPSENDGGGRGLRLVEALSSRWSAERRDGATTVTAVVEAG
jgi:anti-sigma regulatory factor (Ser/Thr protein kinase)